jgi:Ser/Thr protein kinase RdoA (MazF antagonist)
LREAGPEGIQASPHPNVVCPTQPAPELRSGLAPPHCGRGKARDGLRASGTQAIILAMQEEKLQKIAEGREAEMFAWEEGTILRLLRDAGGQQWLQREAAAMKTARDRGVRVPTVHSLTTVMGRPGLVMERIEGPDLLTLVGRRPWKVFWVGRVTGEMHARLHAATGSSKIPSLRETLREWIGSSDRMPRHLAEFALDILNGLPDGDRLCHGDFHPGNILMAGKTPVVIDWTNAKRGDAAGDVARSLVVLSIGEPPPGTSTALRLLTHVGRRLLMSAYLRAYRRARPLDMELVERWVVAQAAARLAFDLIPEEERPLRRLLEERYARSGGATSRAART